MNVISTQFIFKFLKFSVVGASGTLIDFGLTYWCKEKLGLHKYIANSIGFGVAASSNYILNRIWTFSNHDPAIVTQYGKFFIVSVIGLLISNGIIHLLNDRLNLNFYFAKFCGIGVVVVWNFFANYLYTFN